MPAHVPATWTGRAFTLPRGRIILVAGHMLARHCAAPRIPPKAVTDDVLDAACASPAWTLWLIAAALFVATRLLYALPLLRGVTDVGFVGASLRVERRRRLDI
jgi:hypothetical protein